MHYTGLSLGRANGNSMQGSKTEKPVAAHNYETERSGTFEPRSCFFTIKLSLPSFSEAVAVFGSTSTFKPAAKNNSSPAGLSEGGSVVSDRPFFLALTITRVAST